MKRNTRKFGLALTALTLAALMLAVFGAVPAWAATTWNVPGDSTGTCAIGNPSCDTIQDAIDAASDGDTINVAAGTYAEYLHITTDNLTVQGAGIDVSIIDLDGLTPYWHYRGQHGGSPSRSYASRAGVLITGYGSPDQIIEGVTFKGFTVKNAGLNPPITATGTHTGADDAATLTDSSASWADNELVGQWVHNVSDKLIEIDIEGNNPIRSYGLITANDATTVTATLAGGLDNDWDVGDTYVIMPYELYVDVAEDLQDDVRGIGIANGKDISILYCKVINSGYGGITAGYARCVTTHKYSEGITIDHCIVSDHPSSGISIGAYVGPVTITNNVCSNNGSPHPIDPSREYRGTGINLVSSVGTISGTIANNKCKDNGFIGIIVRGTKTGTIDGVTVENNDVKGHNSDQDGAGIFLYSSHWNGHPEKCKNVIVKNNKITKNIRGVVAYNAQDITIEGNKITTDSGSFPQGQGAIKLDGAHNVEVKNNDISHCDGTGIRVKNMWDGTKSYDNTITGNTIRGALFAGIFIDSGAYDNTFTYNTITGTKWRTFWAGSSWEETQADGVFLDSDAGPGNVFHNNNIYGNDDDGMENQVTTTTVDAECNWWGHYSGPNGVGPGIGDAVSINVDFDPWLVLPAGSEFEIEHAKIDFKNKPDDDKVHVKGQLGTLCLEGGVAISDDVNVTVESLSETITMVEKGSKWEYKRPKGSTGPIKHMTIDWKKGKFDFSMDKVDLSGLTDPDDVTISISIGGHDFGSETIKMTVKKHHWDYKATITTKAVETDLLAVPGELKVVAYPNPIRDVDTATFQVMGTLATQVEEIRVQIYDLSGRLVWEDAAPGSELDWHTNCLSGDYLANGIYLYSVQVRIGGNWINQDIGKIAVLR